MVTSWRSKVAVLFATAVVLAPGALLAYAAESKPGQVAGGIPGLPGAVGLEEGDVRTMPGDAVRGLAVFRAFCAGCHNFKAAGMQGKYKTGSDLDARKPTYAKIVTLIVQGGGGGLPSKQLLRQLTFQQIYDVAKFVALYADKTGPVTGATVKPPAPIQLSAPLEPQGSTTAPGAKPAGTFTATLSGRALLWRLVVHGATAEVTAAARIKLSVPGTSFAPIQLSCTPCNEPGRGFVVLTAAQAKALTSGRELLVVQGPSLPNGPLRGQLAIKSS